MKKYIILVFLVFFSSSLQANTPKVNECINDIYFANSIMTSEEDAQTKLDLIEKNILLEKYSGNSEKMNKELNFKTSYNHTHGFYMDLYDTYMYLFHEEDGWETYGNVMELLIERGIGKIINTPAKMAKLSKKQKKAYDDLLNILDLKDYLDIYNTDRSVDLSKQIADYRESIRLGHGVTIVAHGKGDIFTAQAYEDMLKAEGNRDNSWMEEYVSWMSVGSPTREARGFHPYINFDNDTLAYLSTLNVTKNPNRSYIHNAIGEYIENKTDMQFHSFDYYIGEKILFEDGYGERNISTDIGKKVIMEFLSDSIKKHRKAFSQWVLDQELNKGTKDYRITVKNQFDPSITKMDGIEVYPFALDKKLYYVQGTVSEDISGYVKASCGGTKILDADKDTWDNQQDNEVYYLEGTGERIVMHEDYLEIRTKFVAPHAYMDFYINDLHCYQIRYRAINAASYYGIFAGVMVSDDAYIPSQNIFNTVDGVIKISFNSLITEDAEYGDSVLTIHDPSVVNYDNYRFTYTYTLTTRSDFLHTDSDYMGRRIYFHSYNTSYGSLEDILRKLIKKD